MLIAVMFCAILMTGCKSVTQSTKEKQVNIETELYGFKVTAFDPITGATSPTGMFGWGKIYYRSIPIEAGQPFYAMHETYSLWSNNPASKTVIWIGRAAQKGLLQYEGIPNTMIKISGDGIKTGTATLKIVPDKKITKNESKTESTLEE